MTPPEALLFAFTIAAGVGGWLGYVFIVNDAKWKMVRDKGGEAMDPSELAAVQDQISQLRRELLALRDRSSEFDVSLDHRLQQLEAQFRAGSEELPSRLQENNPRS